MCLLQAESVLNELQPLLSSPSDITVSSLSVLAPFSTRTSVSQHCEECFHIHINSVFAEFPVSLKETQHHDTKKYEAHKNIKKVTHILQKPQKNVRMIMKGIKCIESV